MPNRQFEYLRTFLGESMAGPLSVTPWLKLLPPFKAIYWNIRHAMDEFRVAIRAVADEQRRTFEPGHARGYIDKFLQEQRDNRGKYFTDDDLIINCQDLFIAGSETTSKTLSSCFLQMVLNPEVQARIQEEIDCVVGRVRTSKDLTWAE